MSLPLKVTIILPLMEITFLLSLAMECCGGAPLALMLVSMNAWCGE